MNDAPFFTIHSMNAINARSFSIVRANIDNTPEKLDLARSLYPGDDWHFEFHHAKIDMAWVVR